jgi:hypothetical protein
VSCADDNEVGSTTAQIAFDFRNPFSIARADKSLTKSRKIAKRVTHYTRYRIYISVMPGIQHTHVLFTRMLVRDEREQEKATQIMPASHLSWKHLGEEYLAVGRTADAQRAEARAQQLVPAKKKS